MIILSLVLVYFFYINKTTILEKIWLWSWNINTIKTDTNKKESNENKKDKNDSLTNNSSQESIANNKNTQDVDPDKNSDKTKNINSKNNIEENQVSNSTGSSVKDDSKSLPEPLDDTIKEVDSNIDSNNKELEYPKWDSWNIDNYESSKFANDYEDENNNKNESIDDRNLHNEWIVKIPWLTNYNWDIKILGELWINDYEYILTDIYGTYFVYLWNRNTENILNKVIQMWWDYVEIRDKKNIMQNMLFWDIVTFINLDHYQNSKVNILVKFVESNELWLVQVDYSKYYELKPHFVELFNY